MKEELTQNAWDSVNDAEFLARLNRVFALNRLDRYLSRERAEKLFTLARRLAEEGAQYNLSAITDPDGIIFKHFADSAALCPYIPEKATVLDVGTGAGFPSLVLAVCRPDIQVTALDATEKKVRYVEESARLLALPNLRAVCARAEDLAATDLRRSFDVVTARAVSELRILSELCLPFCRRGGLFLAMKSKNAENELKAAKKAIPLLGGKLKEQKSYTLTDGKETAERYILVLEKNAETPTRYPRPYAKILKSPL